MEFSREAWMNRRFLLFVLIGVFASLGASHRTTNFIVYAPTPELAQRIGQWAEYYRREKAVQWLGQEMPPWPQPCPLNVHVTMEGPNGYTSFTFGHNTVLSQKMEIRGPLDRLVASVLPHEITHTVFAYYFRAPVPRWADEGGSVLSEDDLERERHDKLVRQILNNRRQIPVRHLLCMREYPRDMISLYAEGFSLADYLVRLRDRPAFLQFVAQGMRGNNWDQAVQTCYGLPNVDALEAAWLKHLRDTRKQPPGMQVAAIPEPRQNTTAGTMVRMTAPPVQPLDPPAIYRGQAPTSDAVGHRPGDAPGMAAAQPIYIPTHQPPPGTGWQPVAPLPPTQPAPHAHYPAPVILGAPQFDP
jgi:hypothetical protein